MTKVKKTTPRTLVAFCSSRMILPCREEFREMTLEFREWWERMVAVRCMRHGEEVSLWLDLDIMWSFLNWRLLSNRLVPAPVFNRTVADRRSPVCAGDSVSDPGFSGGLLWSKEHVTVDFFTLIRLGLSQITTDRRGAPTTGRAGGKTFPRKLGCIVALSDPLFSWFCTTSSSSRLFWIKVDLVSCWIWTDCRGTQCWTVVSGRVSFSEFHSLYGAILFKSQIELALFLRGAIKLLLNPHELLLEFHSASFTVPSGDSEVELPALVISRTIFGVCAPM